MAERTASSHQRLTYFFWLFFLANMKYQASVARERMVLGLSPSIPKTFKPKDQ